MKKNSQRNFFILIAFLSVLSLCSCRQSVSVDSRSDSSEDNGNAAEVFSDALYWNVPEGAGTGYPLTVEHYQNENAPKTREINFLGETYPLSYAYSFRPYESPYEVDFYQFSEMNCLEDAGVLFKKDTDQLVDISLPSEYGVSLCQSPNALCTEEDFQKFAESIASNFADLNDYSYSCKTKQEVFRDGQCEIKEFDEFVPVEPPEEGETVNTEYDFIYRKEIGGIPTDDWIKVTINGDGSLERLRLHMPNEFDAYSDLQMDREAIEQKALESLPEYCSDLCELEGAQVLDVVLMKDIDGSLMAKVTVLPVLRLKETGKVLPQSASVLNIYVKLPL